MDSGEPPRVTPKFEGDLQSTSADASPTKVPAAIGRYSIIKLLGKGGFGLVYLAHDDQLGRPVVVKVPHTNRVARPEDADLYLAEARTVASLEHPNIVPVYDVGSTPDFPFSSSPSMSKAPILPRGSRIPGCLGSRRRNLWRPWLRHCTTPTNEDWSIGM